MNDIYKRAGGLYIDLLEEEKGWFISRQYGWLCEIDFSARKAKVLTQLGFERDFWKPKYCYGVKVGHLFYLFPGYQSKDVNIAVYDSMHDTIRYIMLEKMEKELSVSVAAIWTWYYARVDKYIFIYGYGCPVVIRLDLETEEIEYITDWLDEINDSGLLEKGFPYFHDGYAVKENILYIPICCMAGILKINIDTLSTEVISIDNEVGGFGGITVLDNSYYAFSPIGKNANKLIIWNSETEQKEKEILLPESFKNSMAPIYRPLKVNENLYLFPANARDQGGNWSYEIYKVHMDSENIEELKILQRWKEDTHAKELLLEFQNTMGVLWVDKKKNICFITGKDMMWHEYNVETDEYDEYYIYYDMAEEDFLKLFSDEIKRFSENAIAVSEVNIPIEALCITETSEKQEEKKINCGSLIWANIAGIN